MIDELVAATEGGHLGSARGRFSAWVIGGVLPSALAADWLVSTWDNNAALYTCGPAAAVYEEVAGAWVKDILRLPSESSFAFTTGFQMAHVTCLAAARHALLATRGWDVEQGGLFGASPIRVLANEMYHRSITRALQMLGIGMKALKTLRTDEFGRVTSEVLNTALDRSDTPTIVMLDAGDLNVAAVDPFTTLMPSAHAAGAWVHVDGAFGLWARSSPQCGGLLDGIEEADSWATDAHKWLNTPKDISIAVVRDTVSHRAAMSITAAYIAPTDDTRDQIHRIGLAELAGFLSTRHFVS